MYGKKFMHKCVCVCVNKKKQKTKNEKLKTAKIFHHLKSRTIVGIIANHRRR